MPSRRPAVIRIRGRGTERQCVFMYVRVCRHDRFIQLQVMIVRVYVYGLVLCNAVILTIIVIIIRTRCNVYAAVVVCHHKHSPSSKLIERI